MPLGALGRRPPTNKRAMTFASILRAGALPPRHPDQVNYLAKLKHWQVLGNDRIGNCAAVTWANDRRLVTALLTGHEQYPTFEQVIELYRTQNPEFNLDGKPEVNGPGSAADGGMVLQDELDHLRKVGGPDGVRAVAFAKVDHNDEQELDAAIAIFGQVWYGVVVQAANEDEFDARQAWDYKPRSPELGGHAVLGGGYTPDPRFITWGVETGFTDAFRTRNVEEVWVVIWPEHFGSKAFQAGVDVQGLADAYKLLTGEDLEIPDVPPAPQPPAPEPVDPPAPTPPVDDSAVAVPRAVFDAWAGHLAARHGLPRYEREALAAYQAASNPNG